MGFSCVPNYKILEKIFNCSHTNTAVRPLTTGGPLPNRYTNILDKSSNLWYNPDPYP